MAKTRQTPTEPMTGGYTGGGIGRLPENRSDEIIMGMPLQVVHQQVGSPDKPMRRDFTEPTRNPLHYLDGPGTDENVTSRAPKRNAPLGNVELTADHDDVRPIQGSDMNKYSAGPDDERTTNGALIYGT